jgi:hypothetical protein
MEERDYIFEELNAYATRPSSPRFNINEVNAKISSEPAKGENYFENEPPVPCFLLNRIKQYFNHDRREEALLA